MTPATESAGGWKDEQIRRHGRRARRALCLGCGAPVWRGLDEDALAFTIQADPTPISADVEFGLIFAGVLTFDFDGEKLTRRTDSMLRRARRMVLPAHRCGIELLTSAAPVAEESTEDNEFPPF